MFNAYQPRLSKAVQDRFEITPSNGSDLAQLSCAIMFAEAGSFAEQLKNSDTITLPELTLDVVYPLRAARVFATATTATGIKGLA